MLIKKAAKSPIIMIYFPSLPFCSKLISVKLKLELKEYFLYYLFITDHFPVH